jgi:hypothetical protein
LWFVLLLLPGIYDCQGDRKDGIDAVFDEEKL